MSGKLAALGRFLAKSAEKSLPFYQAFKQQTGKGKINWTIEAEEALINLKKHVHSLPSLASPVQGEPLLMYLSTNQEAISAVLIAERDGKQVPVYFVSRVLKDVELNYTLMENSLYLLSTQSDGCGDTFKLIRSPYLQISHSDKYFLSQKDRGG